MKIMAPAFLAAGLLLATPAFAAEQTIRIQVGEMTCPSCSYTVATAMRRVPGVKILEFKGTDDFGDGVFVVAYDDQSATAEMILQAITANGYPASLLPADNS